METTVGTPSSSSSRAMIASPGEALVAGVPLPHAARAGAATTPSAAESRTVRRDGMMDSLMGPSCPAG